MTTLKSEEITVHSDSVDGGVHHQFYLGKTDFSLYFPIR